jgi:hypothetical protein
MVYLYDSITYLDFVCTDIPEQLFYEALKRLWDVEFLRTFGRNITH